MRRATRRSTSSCNRPSARKRKPGMCSSYRGAELEYRAAASVALPDTARAANRDAVFDGLRGVAIALVLWHHLVEQALPPGHGSWLGWLRAATNLSWCGVDLFFVISG